jgi:hypothetical protein
VTPPNGTAVRAVVRIAGRLCTIQVPDLPTPVNMPAVEALYPPSDERNALATPTPRPIGGHRVVGVEDDPRRAAGQE